MSRNFRDLFEDYTDDTDTISSTASITTASTILAPNNSTNTRFHTRWPGNETTSLDTSTVPTYEEFLKKSSNKPALFHSHKTNLARNSPAASSSNSQFVTARETTICLVTDDESSSEKDSDDSDDQEEKSKRFKKQQKERVLTSIQNRMVTKSNLPPSPFLAASDVTNVKKLPQTPVQVLKAKKITCVNITPSRSMFNKEDASANSEYVFYNSKDSQTSFNSSVCSETISVSLINDTACVESGDELGKPNLSPQLEATVGESNFQLHLSDDDTKQKLISSNSENETADLCQTKKNVILEQSSSRNVTRRQKTKRKSKRLSICGEGLSEDVLRIDDTIIDQFDNECDHRRGKLVTLSETGSFEQENSSKFRLSMLSSTKVASNIGERGNEPKMISAQLKRISESSSGDDDQYERFLNDIKSKNSQQLTASTNNLTSKRNRKNDLDDFIVKDDNIIEEEEDDAESSGVVKTSAKNIKSSNKKPLPKSKPLSTRRKNVIYSSSSSSERSVKSNYSESSDANSEEEEEEEQDFDQYNKDLQLFYIKTTNKIANENEKKKNKLLEIKKPAKDSKVSRSSLLDDSSSDEQISTASTKNLQDHSKSSPTSSLYSSSSSSSSSVFSLNSDDDGSSNSTDIDDKFSQMFRRTMTLTNKAAAAAAGSPAGNFRKKLETPSRNKNTKASLEQRLVKTQAIVRHKPPRKLSFIESLSTVLDNEEQRDPDALKYISKFSQKKAKEDLLRVCYDEFNKHAFDDKLPKDMVIKWSSRLRSTGGYCKNSMDKMSGERSCEIHVSTKVCDSAERMRDTLCHEMCHAAAFLINGVRDGHGPIWKSWANRVNFTFKLIPKITVTHSYAVTKKYIYKCTKCSQEIHRFSKSIDMQKEVCGLCYGRFELVLNTKNNLKLIEANKKSEMEEIFSQLTVSASGGGGGGGRLTKKPAATNSDLYATPRAPSKFALYVKENYNSVKREAKLIAHKDVMQELSKKYKQDSAK